MDVHIISSGLNLILWGALMFVIGLAQGVTIPFYRNSRMGLSAHLTAVQCGMALIIFGMIWSLVKLDALWLSITMFGFVAGFYLIWFGITISAITGASKALPIAGDGYCGDRMSEISVKIIEMTGVLLSLMSGVLFLFGLFRTAQVIT